MRVVTYRRVSTEMQVEKFSLSAQESKLKAYVESQGWTLVQDYADEGYSAKNMTERPALQELLKDMKKKKFDIVLVYKLDRLVRNVGDLHQLLKLFDESNIKFKSATEMFDTTSAMGRFFITLVGAMAEWERENLGERVYMGMLKKHEEGKYNGSITPFGYYRDENGNLAIKEDEAEVVKKIFDDYKTKGTRVIADELNKKGIYTRKGARWSDFTIGYVLKNPIYAGYVQWGVKSDREHDLIIKGNHEPIIDAATFEKVARTLKQRNIKKEKTHVSYPFTGILKCGRCGLPMSGAKRQLKSKLYRFYRCKGRHYKTCDMPYLGERIVEDEFIRSLKFVIDDVVVDPQEEVIDVNEIQDELKRVQKRIERIKDLYIDGELTRKKYEEKIQEEKEKEMKLISSLDSAEQPTNPQVIKDILRDLKEHWEEITREKKKELIQTLFDYITIECILEPVPARNEAIVEICDYKLQ